MQIYCIKNKKGEITMTDAKKIEMLEEMMELEAGTLTPETVLNDIEEWDSIALISFIALMDDEFDKVVKGSVVKEQKTVADLMALMEK